VISNIYMHYVLVWWFKECVKPKLKGYGGLAVYADYTEIKTMPKHFIEFNIHRDFYMRLSA
jgi:hypothetical protein